jgi:nicotinamide-nucleotide amidase
MLSSSSSRQDPAVSDPSVAAAPPPVGLEASMIVIGDEILGGYVTDANSPYLADRLQHHGVPLTRIHVVPDDAGDIDEALQAELARSRPRLIVTSGGIGSTPDDITFEAVAASLGRGLVEDPEIAARLHEIAAWTREQGMDAGEEFTWHLLRMARVPDGSRLLRHGDSWVPAVAVDVDGGQAADGATVVVLPGVPSEFRRLVAGVLEPTFLAGRNDVPTVAEVEHGLPESALNLTFTAMLERYPQVKLGSYPGRPMLVRLTGRSEDVAGAEAMVRSAITALESSPGGANLAAAWSARRARSRPEEDA